MSDNVSMQHTTVTVNGHRCGGWAAAADAFQLPDITMAAHEVGADGLKVVASNGMRGGPVVFKFLANSPSRAQFQRWASQVLRGAAISFEGSWSNSQTGESGRMERGHMEVAPAGTTMGNAVPPQREFTIVFESVIANFDGVRSQSMAVPSPARTPANEPLVERLARVGRCGDFGRSQSAPVRSDVGGLLSNPLSIGT